MDMLGYLAVFSNDFLDSPLIYQSNLTGEVSFDVEWTLLWRMSWSYFYMGTCLLSFQNCEIIPFSLLESPCDVGEEKLIDI